MSNSAEKVARLIADLQRRIEALERGNHLQRSSVRAADGTQVPVVPALVSASGMLAQALADSVAGAQADGLVDILYSDTEPLTAAEGDYWVRTYDNQLFKYISGVWIDYNNRALSDALAQARRAGDGKIRTFWQATAPSGADTGDLWFETDNGNRAYRYTLGAWQSLQLGTGALIESGIDPSRLTVGITGNLFQDPIFKTGIRIPPAGWAIISPDTVYPDSNFVRSTVTSGLPSSWTWTQPTTVDPGRSVRIASLVRPSTGALSATAKLQVIFSKPIAIVMPTGYGQSYGLSYGTVPAGYAQGFTSGFLSFSVPGLDTFVVETEITWPDSTLVNTWTVLEGIFDVPEGYTTFQVAAVVDDQTTGTIDFIKPEVQVLWNRVRSSAYVEGESGWSFDDQNVQVPNMNVLGTLGASEISTDVLEIDGEDVAETINALPKGVIAYARSYGVDTAQISTTRAITHEFHGGALVHGRMYRMHIHGQLASTTTDAQFDVLVHYTNDGTTPTTASAVLDGSLTRCNIGPFGSNRFDIELYYYPALDYANTKFSLAMARVAGTGTGSITLTDINKNTEFMLEDMGEYVADVTSGGGGVLSQKSKSAGSADGTPTTTYTKSWYSTWSRSYDGNFNTRSGDTSDLYQGYSSTRVFKNQRSLFGFDYADIQSVLTGATVKSIKLTFKTKRVADSNGITLYLSSHDYTAKPSTFGTSRVNNDRIHWASQKEGVTYTHTLPLALGTEFQSGTTKGLGFGPAPSSSFNAYYGYCYGGTTSTSRPKLTITYTK